MCACEKESDYDFCTGCLGVNMNHHAGPLCVGVCVYVPLQARGHSPSLTMKYSCFSRATERGTFYSTTHTAEKPVC